MILGQFEDYLAYQKQLEQAATQVASVKHNRHYNQKRKKDYHTTKNENMTCY